MGRLSLKRQFSCSSRSLQDCSDTDVSEDWFDSALSPNDTPTSVDRLSKLPRGGASSASASREPQLADRIQEISIEQREHRASSTSSTGVEQLLCDQPEAEGCFTPELHKVSDNPNNLFPLFRPITHRKVIHIIRHGESEYNAAAAASRSWGEIMIFDPKLTRKGRLQASTLREQLKTKNLKGALWAVSPLSRAIETFLLACPDSHLLKDAAAGRTAYGTPPKVALLPQLSEHLMTPGDVGRPPSEIAKEFPELAKEANEITENTWWYSNPKSPNDALAKCFNVYESKARLQSRVGEFRRWALEQPESVIIAVGHSMFWKSFLDCGRTLKNCELYTTTL